MNQVRVWVAAASLAGIVALLHSAGPGNAGDNKEAVATVKKIAAALKGGDMDAAKKLAAGAKKFELEEVMDLFKTVKKGGIGWTGAKPTDGIESKIRELARDGDKNVSKNAAALEEIAYTTAAISLIADAKTPEKDQGKKLRKNWQTWAQDMNDGAHALAKAAKGKAAADVKTAATKVNNSCNACHSDFRQ